MQRKRLFPRSNADALRVTGLLTTGKLLSLGDLMRLLRPGKGVRFFCLKGFETNVCTCSCVLLQEEQRRFGCFFGGAPSRSRGSTRPRHGVCTIHGCYRLQLSRGAATFHLVTVSPSLVKLTDFEAVPRTLQENQSVLSCGSGW